MSDHTTISALPADCLLHIFQSLPLRDVLNCRGVCKSWRKFIKTKQLWKNVTLDGMQILDWKKATQNFKKWKTIEIDFDYNMEHYMDLLPTPQLCELLGKLKNQLRYLCFNVLRIEVLEFITTDSQFIGLEALSVKVLTGTIERTPDTPFIEYFDVGRLGRLHHLKELRLNLDEECVSYSLFSFNDGLNALADLTQLRILSLTSLKSNNSHEFGFLTNLTELVELQLGDASAIPAEAFKSMSQLPHLCRLSLINGDCMCDYTPCQCEWVDLIGKLTNLVELELEFVNTIPRLNKSLMKMEKLKIFKVIPLETDFIPNRTTFSVQDAKESNILDVLDGLTWLKSLTWGVYCPLEVFDTRSMRSRGLRWSIKDNTGTLTAVKDNLQLCLPNTEILILPVLTPWDEQHNE